MDKGNWTIIDNTEIVAANEYRDVLTIQLTNSVNAVLGFGKAAVFGEGIRLINAGDSITVRGHLARGAVYARIDSLFLPVPPNPANAAGIWHDSEIEYRPGPQVA